MTWSRLVQAELRKLTSTRMPWAFLAVLVAISATTATAVIFGTDMDGSKAFIATAGDQQSLMAFAANAMMIAALFGAIAVAREYGHGTVIPTFLTAPRRHRAVLAQLTAVMVGGGLLGLVGAALTGLAVTLALPMTEYNDAAFLEQMVTVQRSEAAGSRSRRHPATGGASGHLVHRKAEDDRRVSTNLGRADPIHSRVLGVEPRAGPEFECVVAVLLEEEHDDDVVGPVAPEEADVAADKHRLPGSRLIVDSTMEAAARG